MAARGVTTTGGGIDAGYRGEILVLMTNLSEAVVELKAGEKIAQMIPVPVLTGEVVAVESLEESARVSRRADAGDACRRSSFSQVNTEGPDRVTRIPLEILAVRRWI